MTLSDTEFTADEVSGPVIESETTKKLLGKVDRRTAMKVVASAGMAGLAGCTSGSENDGSGGTKSGSGQQGDRYGGRLKAGWNVPEVTRLDPHLAPQGYEIQIHNNVTESLVDSTPKLELYGSLAKNWSTDDAKTWTFELVKDAKWQKGYGKVTAQDWKNTYKRAMSLKGSTDKSRYASIKGEPGDGGIEVVNDHKLRLHLKKRNVAAPMLFGLLDWVNTDATEEMGRQKHNLKPVGCGPFEITKHEVGQGITLDRFDGFYKTDEDVPYVESKGDKLPFLDGIDISMVPEPSTMANALQTGEVEFANFVPKGNVPTVKKMNNVVLAEPPAAGWQNVFMNCLREPFGKDGIAREGSKYHKTRLGIAKSIDKKEFVQQAYQGNVHPAIGPIPPAHKKFYRKDKPDYQAYNPEEGKQLLKEAGSLNASVTILANQNSLRESKVLKNQLDDVLDVTLESVPQTVFLERIDVTNHDFDMAISGAGADIAMYDWFYEQFRPPDGHPNAPEEMGGGLFNDSILYDETVAKNVAKVQEIVDEKERIDLIHKTEDRMMNLVFGAYLYHDVAFQAHGKNVKGYPPHLQDRKFVSTWKQE